MKLIDKATFVQLVRDKKSDYYYKAFKSWDEMIVMFFGLLSRCDSMAEICGGMKALGGKLNQLRLQKASAKVHDKNYLTQITVPIHSMSVFGRAYNYYKQFANG